MVRISNLKLIKILLKNARKPYPQVAKEFNVSETAIRKRVKKLEQEQVILGFTIDVNPKKLGYSHVVLLGIDTLPEKLLEVTRALKEKDEVIKLYLSSGDHMIMAECWFESSEEFMNFIKELESNKSITKVCPAILVERLK